MGLPNTGDQNWGAPLDAFILGVQSTANSAQTSVNGHIGGTDPHGDRAYANTLVTPITTGVNLPNGFVKLNSSGLLATNLLPAGAYRTNFVDVVHDYAVVAGTGADQSTNLQNALTAVGNAGGGEVWVPNGVYTSDHLLIISSNTWLHLAPGAIIKRGIPNGGSAPSQMISNVNFAATPAATPSGTNILISGGMWDATGGGALTSSCRPIILVQTSFCAVTQTVVLTTASSCCVELNGATNITVKDCAFGGNNNTSANSTPAVRINTTSTSTTPTGLAAGAYNNAVCNGILVEGCAGEIGTNTNLPFSRMVGTDLYSTGTHGAVTVKSCYLPSFPLAVTPPCDGTHISALHTVGNTFYGDNTLDLSTSGQIYIGPTNGVAGGVNAYVNGILTFASGVRGNITPETWHSLSLSNSWTGSINYKMQPDGRVAISVNLGAGSASAPTAGTLPAGYRPQSTQYIAAGGNGGGQGWSASIMPYVEIDTSGALSMQGMHALPSSSGTFLASGTFPIDL